jgi:membrane protease YdiL (CAAX protease family)
MTRAAIAAAAFEIAIILAGAWLIWRHVFSRRSKDDPAARLPEWRLAPVDFACFLCFPFVGATSLSAAAGYLLRHSGLGPDALAVTGSAAMDTGVLIGLGGFSLMYGAPVLGLGRTSVAAATRSGTTTFLAAWALVEGTSLAWEFLITKLGLPSQKQDMVGILQNTQSGAVRWSLVAVATLLVPVAEELIFRAGLFRYFRTRMPRWVAITLTSALFAALHVSWGDHLSGLPSFAPLMVLAAVFCLAYERTGSIGTTVVAHALFNLNTFLLVASGLGT